MKMQMRSQRPHAAATGMTCGAELQDCCITQTVSTVVAGYVTVVPLFCSYNKPSIKSYFHFDYQC